MAPRATDMISEISAAMKLEATIAEIAETIHPASHGKRDDYGSGPGR